MQDGILYQWFKDLSGQETKLQLVVPGTLRDEVLANLHEGQLGRHLSVEKTLSRLKGRFYWPGYHQDMQNWCGKCAICAKWKSPSHPARAPLSNIKPGY